MKILLVSNYRPDAQQSMLRYAEMIERASRLAGDDVEVFYPPVIFGRLPFLRGPLAKWIGYIDKYLLAPFFLRRKARWADVVHVCDHSNSMYLPCAGRKPAVITCHDLLAVFSALDKFDGVRTGSTGRILQNWIASNLVRAKHIICVSHKTLDDVRTLAPNTQADLRVIHHPLNWDYSPAPPVAVTAAKLKAGLDREAEYLLHVGGNQWYKNRLGVMQIFAELRKYPRFQDSNPDVKLLLAGKPWTAEMRQYCKSAGLENAAIEYNEASNQDLQALYSGALALLFPSHEEGFGWPILEAQACGCPVITSNRAPMTEIAGSAALFVDPAQPDRAAQIIAEHAPQLPSLQQPGFKNLKRFTPEQAFSSYREVYRELANKKIENCHPE